MNASTDINQRQSEIKNHFDVNRERLESIRNINERIEYAIEKIAEIAKRWSYCDKCHILLQKVLKESKQLTLKKSNKLKNKKNNLSLEEIFKESVKKKKGNFVI